MITPSSHRLTQSNSPLLPSVDFSRPSRHTRTDHVLGDVRMFPAGSDLLPRLRRCFVAASTIASTAFELGAQTSKDTSGSVHFSLSPLLVLQLASAPISGWSGGGGGGCCGPPPHFHYTDNRSHCFPRRIQRPRCHNGPR